MKHAKESYPPLWLADGLWGLALWALTFAPTSSAPEPPIHFQPCFTHADPVSGRPTQDMYAHALRPGEGWRSSFPISFSQNSAGAIEQDPGPLSPSIAKRVGGAVVKLTTVEDGKLFAGSGVLVRVSTNESVVITAAHVAPPKAIDTIRVTSPNDPDVESGVISGCYASLNNQNYLSAQEKRYYEGYAIPIDLAVLRLRRPLGATALSLASSPPLRGAWVTFCNFQADRPVTDSVAYNGVALNVQTQAMANLVLTGAAAEPIPVVADMPVKDKQRLRAILPGASGGVIVERQHGDVAGISVSSSNVSTDTLSAFAGVTIKHPHANTVPRIAGVVDALFIKQAIASGKWLAPSA